MTSSRPLTILAVLLIAIFYSNLAQYLFSSGLLPVPPSGWLIVVGLALLVIILVRFPDVRLRLHPLVVWAFAYILVTALWALAFGSIESGVRELGQNVYFAAMLIVSLMLFASGRARNAVMKTIVVVTLMSVAANILEFYRPGLFSDVLGRSAGLYVNPNMSGAALSLGMILGSVQIPPRWLFPYRLLVGLGALLTFSRGALIAWVVVFVFQTLYGLNVISSVRSITLGATLLTLAALSPVGTSFVDQALALQARNPAAIERIQSLGNQSFGDDARVELLKVSWSTFLQRPGLGHGSGAAMFDIGASIDLGSHNQILSMMVQYGVVGLLLFGGLLFSIYVHPRDEEKPTVIATIVFLSVMAFFTHGMLKQWPYAIAIALVASMSSYPFLTFPRTEHTGFYNRIVRK